VGKRNKLGSRFIGTVEACVVIPRVMFWDSQETAGFRKKGGENMGFFVPAGTMTIREGVRIL